VGNIVSFIATSVNVSANSEIATGCSLLLVSFMPTRDDTIHDPSWYPVEVESQRDAAFLNSSGKQFPADNAWIEVIGNDTARRTGFRYKRRQPPDGI